MYKSSTRYAAALTGSVGGTSEIANAWHWVLCSLLNRKPTWMVLFFGRFEFFAKVVATFLANDIRSRCAARDMLTVIVLSILLTPTVAVAQEEIPDLDRPWPEILKDGVIQPKVFIQAIGADGKPVYVPNTTLEEILTLRGKETANDASPRLPDFTYENVTVSVDARNPGIAVVESEFQIRLGTENAVRVPLRMDTVRTTQPHTTTGSAESSQFQISPTGGYDWLVKGSAGTSHSIRLNGKSNIVEDSLRSSLKLALPSTPCTVKVYLPPDAFEARARAEDVLDTQIVSDAIEVTIAANGGDLPLAWRTKATHEQLASVEADSSTVFSIGDPTQTWQASSRVTVDWYGVDADNDLILSLPVGARLRTLPNVDDYQHFRITRVSSAEGRDSAQKKPQEGPEQLLIENFDIEQAPNLVLQLQWEWNPSVTKEGRPSSNDIPGLQIQGVDSHHGFVECNLPSFYSITFEEAQNAFLARQIHADPITSKKVLRFEFTEQDFHLKVGFRKEQSLPIVRPTYHLRVDENKLLLTAWLDVSFDANQFSQELRLDMSDTSWIVQENTAVVVDPTNPLQDNGQSLRIRRVDNDDRIYVVSSPLQETTDQTANARIQQTWRIEAERGWTPADGNELEFTVPRIVRGSTTTEQASGSGTLIVTSDNNLLLRSTISNGFLADSFSSEYQKYLRDPGFRTPLVFRIQPQITLPRWKGEAEVLPQQASLAQQAEITVNSSQIDVSQTFDLNVANKEFAELRFAIREDVEQTPQVFINDNSLSYQYLTTMTQEQMIVSYPNLMPHVSLANDEATGLNEDGNLAETEKWRVYSIQGPPKLLGAKQVRLSTSVPWSATTQSDDTQEVSATRVSVPLARLLVPSSTQLLGGEWTLNHGGQISVAPIGNNYSTSQDGPGPLLRDLVPSLDQIPMEIRVDQSVRDHLIRIERSWLQTAITDDQQRDRFAAVFTTSSSQLSIRLPKYIDLRRVILDGLEVASYRYDDVTETLIVDMPSVDSEPHLLEILYFQQGKLGWITHIDVEAPEIVSADSTDLLYWQLLTPGVHHLGWCPKDLSAEWQWQWAGFWWERVSNVEVLDSFGATKLSSVPLSFNSYLMSGYGIKETTSTWVFRRYALWFPIGSIAIALTFCVWNFAFFRSPLTLVFYALTIAAVATVWPDIAVLVGQTSMLALGLVALFMAVQVAIDSRVRRRSVFTSRPLSTVDTGLQFNGSRSFVATNPPISNSGSGVAANGEG